ncbi:MAG: amidohydrolase family protein [Candidatus Jorgensenbacteria bacterium]|nr:amidohydrolase family protein [Candidatus Jorgensenbacteria bacterium]
MKTLIKNGLVYDGSGSAPSRRDILIRGKYIAKCGTLSREQADVVIDAGGASVMPGFIDITSHSDHHMSIFYEPHQEDFIKQGITTIIGGNCGVSLAPILNGSLESIREWGNVMGTNINWHSVKDFLSTLSKRKIGVNFGTLVGHTSMRRAITQNKFRDLTESELEMLKKMVSDSIKEGAFGLSVGLEHTHAIRTPFSELKELVKTVSSHNAVYATHLRDTQEGLNSAIDETLELADETNANIEIQHLQPLKKYKNLYEEAAKRIEKESARHRINFDVNPFDSIPSLIYELLPKWFNEENIEIMHKKALTRAGRERLLPYLKENAPRDCFITHVTDPSLKYLEGKSIKEFSLRNGIKYEEGILKIMELTHLRATLAIRNVDTDTLNSFLAHPNSIISTNSAAFGKKEFKFTPSTETFPSFLRFADGSKLLSVEKAIHKSTSIPAQKYGIKNRGKIEEGYFADITILSNFEPTHVFINGELALNDGKSMHLLAGSVLKK